MDNHLDLNRHLNLSHPQIIKCGKLCECGWPEVNCAISVMAAFRNDNVNRERYLRYLDVWYLGIKNS